jgi:hypothetical protein
MNSFNPPVINKRNKTAIRWTNGVPEPYYEEITPASIKSLAVVASSLPYEGDWDEDLQINIVEPRFEGMTNIEVMYIRIAEKAAHGNLEAANIMLDRILGKPKQSVESTSMTMSYQEYLNVIAQEESKHNGKQL